MKIAILGTRGIPNNYSGFEQLAEYLSIGLVKKGHEVYVYNSHNHVYRENTWNQVQIVHRYDPEFRLGTFGQFIYDLNCILDSRSRKPDIIIQLGYTSSTVWFFLLPRHSRIATNMDGLEWKRSKYNYFVRQFLKVAEWLGVVSSDVLIADSIGIRDYLLKRYSRRATYIAYGAEIFTQPDADRLKAFGVVPYEYDILIARMEPENNIATVLEGKRRSESKRKFLVVGGYDRTAHGRYLKEKFESDDIVFTGSIFDIGILNNLRYFSNLYFHGHSVGGTNPSLLEAMASNALICAHDNAFNRAVLGNDAYYFKGHHEVTRNLDKLKKDDGESDKTARNLEKIKSDFSWETIVGKYEKLIEEIVRDAKGD